MKRKWMISALAGLGLLCAHVSAATPDTTPMIRLEGRVSNLELLRDNLDDHVELKKQELDAAVFRTNTYIKIGIAVTILGIIGGFSTIWRARRKAIAYAEDLIVEELKRKIPESTQRKTKEFVKLLSAYDMESILVWAKSQLRDQRIKQEAQIAIWVESEAEMETAQNEVRGWGFRNVVVSLPSENVLPTAAMTVFYRPGSNPDSGWKRLSDAFVKHTLDTYREDKKSIFFYYGPQNDSLNPKMHPRFGLANMPSTAPMHMLRLLGQHMTFEDE